MGNRYTIMFSRTLDGSGRDKGILVKLSNVMETLSHVWQLSVDFSWPKKRKKIKDQSLLKEFDHDSKPRSITFRLSELGFST